MGFSDNKKTNIVVLFVVPAIIFYESVQDLWGGVHMMPSNVHLEPAQHAQMPVPRIEMVYSVGTYYSGSHILTVTGFYIEHILQ